MTTSINAAATGERELVRELTEDDLALVSGGGGKLFEIEDYSFDIEQVLSIGSQSTGAGTGRVK
jgi:glycerate-2-kinase